MANAQLPLLTTSAVRLNVQAVTIDGNISQNIFDYITDQAGAVAPSDMTAFINAWWTANQAALRNVLSDECTIQDISCALMTHNTVRTVLVVPGGSRIGTQASAALDTMLGAVMSRYTAIRGKHGQGRSFFPAVPVSFLTGAPANGRLSVAALADYNSLGVTLATTVTAAGIDWRYALLSPPAPGAAVVTRGDYVILSVARVYLGTQRRRRQGIGM